MPDTPERRTLRQLVGKLGVAKSVMLPSGAVLIDGQTIDALSEGHADRSRAAGPRDRSARQPGGRSGRRTSSRHRPTTCCRSRSNRWASIRSKIRWLDTRLVRPPDNAACTASLAFEHPRGRFHATTQGNLPMFALLAQAPVTQLDRPAGHWRRRGLRAGVLRRLRPLLPLVDSVGDDRGADRHLRPVGHDVSQGQSHGDRAQQDHGRAGRLDRRDGHHQQGARGPLPGRRQRAAGDSLDHRRQEGQDDRSRFQAGHGHRPGRPQRARSRADQRLSQGDRLPGPRRGAANRSTRSPRTASSSRSRPASPCART